MKSRVIEFKDLSDSREMVEHKIPKFMLWFFYFVLITVIFILTWSYFGKKEIVVQSSGIVKTENTQMVIPIVNSRVTSVNYVEGDYVETGDLIVSLDASSIEFDILSYKNTLDNYERDLELLNIYKQSVIEEENKFTLDHIDEVSKYYEVEAFLESLIEIENKVKAKNEKIANLSASITQTNMTITQVNNELEKLNIQLENYNFYADFDGIIHFDSEITRGSTVQAGYELFRVYEETVDKTLVVQLYVMNTDIVNIKTGQLVRVEIPSLSSREYGYAEAEVVAIESDSRFDQNSGQSYYVVTAVLNESELSSETKTESVIVGMQVQGRLIVDEQRYLFWAIEKLELWIFD